MIDYIWEMPFKNRIIWIVAFIIIRLLIDFLSRIFIKKEFKKTASVDAAINKYRLMNTYVSVPYSILLIIAISLLLLPDFENMYVFALIPSFFISIFISFLLGFVKTFLLSPVICKLRQITMTKKQLVIGYLKNSLILYTPFVFIVVGTSIIQSLNLDYFTEFAILLGYLIILSLVLNYIIKLLYPRLTNSIPLDGALKEDICKMAESLGFSKVKLYKWKTSNKKIANAFVIGLKKNIYVADYFIDNSTNEEILSVIAHELGHIKLKHVLKRMLLGILGGVIFLGTLFWIEEFKYWYEFETKLLILGIEFSFITF